MSKRLSDLVFAGVNAVLKPEGFRLFKSKKWFLRKTDGRTEKFQLVVLNDRPGYRICPSVGVRFEAVEQVFHRTSTFGPEFQPDTDTVGVDLWRIHGKGGYQLPVHNESDVPPVVDRILEIFRRDALPYFSQFSDLKAVDMAVNERPQEQCVHRVLPSLRCATGAIVAKLTDRENFDALIASYREQLRHDANGFYLPTFEALIQDLTTAEVGAE